MAEVMKPVSATACPDLESIAAYLDGRLNDPERARMTEHLASCEECYALFSESAQAYVVPEARTTDERFWQRWFPAPRLAWASAGAALAVAASVLLLVTYGRLVPGEPNGALQAIVAAVGTDRPIEARLSGGFAYGPLRGPVRAGGPAMLVSPDVRIAAATAEKNALAHPTPQSLRALGIAYLAVGQFDKGVGALEQAARQAPADATMLSDLAAGYLARGQSAGSAEDFVKAASEADKATKLNPSLPEARFNRALALEALSRPVEARESWERYVEMDRQSMWAEEAQRHLQALAQKPGPRQ